MYSSRAYGQRNVIKCPDRWKILRDVFHFETENEPLENITDNGDILKHFHIANPDGRLYPKKSDDYDYTKVVKAMKQIGYDGNLSIEGKALDFEKELPESISFLKEIFASDNFRKKMTSALCYLIGVIVILCDFWSGVYHVGLWEGSLNRLFPVHTQLRLCVRSFLGTLYPLRAYLYGRASFFCPEGCLIARQSKYSCLATR